MYKVIARFWNKKKPQVIERNNAGSFYRFTNSNLSCKRGLIGVLSCSARDVIVGDAERAEMRNSFYQLGLCTRLRAAQCPCAIAQHLKVMTKIVFAPGQIHFAINKLKANGSCDSMVSSRWSIWSSAAVVQANYGSRCRTTLACFHVTHVSWLSSNTASYSYHGLHEWSVLWVSNYRPISLTCIACRINVCHCKRWVIYTSSSYYL